MMVKQDDGGGAVWITATTHGSTVTAMCLPIVRPRAPPLHAGRIKEKHDVSS